MKFKDVTNTSKGQEVVNVLLSNSNGLSKDIKVYTHKNTVIIFSLDENSLHASLSNENRKISMLEINHTVTKLMKTNIDSVKIIQTSSGVLHIFK